MQVAKVKIKIITPIHIGDGNEYMPFDYVIDKSNKKLKVVDKLEFQKKIASDPRLKKEFLSFSEHAYKLTDFVKRHAKKFIYEADISNKASQDLTKDSKNIIRRPVHTFIKDKFLNRPIIPGSSVKGAIRTAIADYVTYKIINKKIKNNIPLKIIEDIEKNPKQHYKKLEAIVFCGETQYDAKEDILKALHVSDFKPIKYKLKVIKPINVSKKGKENAIPVILETVAEGEFEGEIRIDTHLLKGIKEEALKNFKLSIENIKKILKAYYIEINNTEKKHWETIKIPKYEEYMIKIGKHTGAGSKTIRDLAQIKSRTSKKPLSYQTSTWCDESKQQLGWVKLIFE